MSTVQEIQVAISNLLSEDVKTELDYSRVEIAAGDYAIHRAG